MLSYREMKRFFGFIVVIVLAISLGGCFGSGGNSAPPPGGVSVAAKDSRVVVTWTPVPGVEYWVWAAIFNGTGVTPLNCSSLNGCTTVVNVASPASVSKLVNGTEYSFTVNGRTNGGPGGSGSAALLATPRLAGATWTTGANTGANDLRGVAYGAIGTMFVDVGLGGISFSSTDGSNWTPVANFQGADLYAITYDSVNQHFVSVGVNGSTLWLSPSPTSPSNQLEWIDSTVSGTIIPTLYAIANNGAGLVVAAGDGGAIISSKDGGRTWTTPILTGITLYGMTYGYSSTLASNVFVAVGALGTVLYSKDGINWNTETPMTSVNLRGISYGAAAGTFVAVGDSGTVLTSADGITWNSPNQQQYSFLPTTVNLNAVTYAVGREFVAVGDAENIMYSVDGINWAPASITPTPSTLSPLYAITTGGLYDYSAVGGGGLNLYAD